MEEEITLLSSSSSSTSSSSLSIETCYHHDDSELVRLRRYSNDFLRSIPPRPHTLTFGAYESMEMMKQDESRETETQSECKMETNEKKSQVQLNEVIKDNQAEQLITIKTEDDEQVESSAEIECNQEPEQSESEMVKVGCINDQRSVKIKVNDLTPSSSQEFIGPAVGGRRSPGTPSSLASSTCSSPQASPVSTPCKSPTPVDPSATSHSTSTSTSTNTASTCGSTTTIGGTTAKRCAKRNSNSGLPGSSNNLKQSNHTVNDDSLNHSKQSREMVSDPIIRRKSWSSSIDQAGLGQNELVHFIGDAPHRVVSLSSLDSDIEETFYDARESDSPKRKMTQAKPNEQPSNTNSNHKKTIFTLTRYSSISASRLDDIVNTIDDPSEGEDKLRLKATGLTVSFEDLTLSESSDHKESQNTSTVNLQFDKPRSLSAASSSEAIFNLNHHQSSSSPSQCNHENAPMVQSARSMSDIINVKPSLLDECSSMKSESNSSSRESISPSTLSGNLTSKRLVGTSVTPSTPLTSSKSSSSVKKVEPVTSPSTVTASKATPTSTSPCHYYHYQYLTPPRSTLHKSISTPSILTAQEAVEEQSTPHERRDKNLSYISNQESDDEKSISKRKKRGSLFFRKKRKDKEVKKVSPHQFVSVCYSIAALCDVCKKALANKPAIKCENCMVTVHDSSCKDQILDCNKFRLAKKPSHLALTTKDRTISPMLQVPPGRLHYHPLRGFPSLFEYPDMEQFPIIGSNAKSSSPTSSVKEKKLVGFSKNHQSSSTLDTQGITCKPPSSSSPSKVICEDKELDTGEDGHSNIVETASGSMESLDEGVAEVITSEFEDDSALRLLDDEPESWNNTVDKKVLKRLKEKDIRRQEVIHELIITEKHHCLTLKIMQKIYAQGMIKELHMTKDMVERIFPCLEDLLEAHLTFLKKLRERQSLDSVIDNIGDIILQQFSGSNGEQLRNCYGQFCSQHKEALSLYKDILKTDRKFQNFIKKCSMKPVCKTRGIPECILLVTQRITKYPLLIDSLLKVTKDSKCDYSDLKDALIHCKNVINRVDAQVAEKEKEIRLLEIYNKIDAKSTTIFKGKKFRKSDLLSNNRKLRHEAVLSWKSARGKVVDVIGVILSDVIILLQENNQKYHFCSLDNKSSVVSLQKLLVREKAGQLSRGVYLISSNPHEPEMYELICPTAKEQKNLIDQIREAVEICPDEEEDCPNEGEERKIEEARKAKVRELLNSMYEKDARMAQMCEDKMKIFADMMELLGIEQEGIELIRYVPMIEDNCSPETIINAANEAFRIAHNLYVSGTNLCRSVSSAGEHQSDTFVSPILPKRAETFGGFDNPEKDPLLRLNALKKKLGQLKDSPFKENVTGDSRPSEVDPDGSALNMGSTLSTASSSSSSTTTMTQGPTNESFLAIRPTLTDHRRSSGPLVNKCSSNASSPEKTQRRSLVTTPTPSIQSLFASSSTTLAPISPSSSTSSSSSMFATLPLYDPSDIYRLTTTPLLMTQGKDQLIQIAELQHQVNLLMCLFNYQQTLFENMRFQLMDSNNKIIQLQKDNIYGGNNGRDAKSDRRSVYRPEQGLEELRNLQEQLRSEKSEWIKKLNEEKTGIESERKSLEDLKEQVRKEQKDVEEQREMLYRKLEALQKEGIILSPAHTIVNTGNLRINPDLVNRGNGLNNNSLVSNNSNNNNNSPCTGISDCDRLTGSSCNQFTRSVATNFNNISFPSCVSSTPGTTVSSETPSLTSSDKVNQSSSSTPRTPSIAFNSGSNSSPIKQQLPLKLAVNESGQGRCNHSQVVNSPSNQQIPATIGNIPVSKVFLAQF